MIAAAPIGQIFAGAVWGVIAGGLTSFGAFVAFLILSFVWSEVSGNKLARTAKFTAFLIVGVLFLGLGGLFAPLALGGYVAVGMYTDDSTPKAVDVSFFIFFFGTILAYLAVNLREFLTEQRSKSDTQNEGEQGVDPNA
jgi:hypothetical protein